MQRLRSSGRAIFRAVRPRSSNGDGSSSFDALSVPSLRRKASNSWSAVQDTYLSTKEVFEKHRVVFTIGTSIASVLTAWAGYSLRHYHHSRVEERLMSIEEAMKHKTNAEHEELKKIVNSGNVSTEACIATAWAALLLGFVPDLFCLLDLKVPVYRWLDWCRNVMVLDGEEAYGLPTENSKENSLS